MSGPALNECRASGFGLRASGFGLRASSFEPRASSFELRASSFELRASSFELRARSGRPGDVVDQVVDDERLPLGGVLAHEELERLRDLAHRLDVDLDQADVVADELAELLRADLAQSLEAGDLGVLQLLHRGVALGLGVAVLGGLLVAHAEQRGLEDE